MSVLQVTLDDKLVEKAKLIGRHPNEAAAITAALLEYIARRQQERVINLFGKIEYDPAYDYRAQRDRS